MGTILIVASFLTAFVAAVTKTTEEQGKFPGNVKLGGWLLIGLAILTAYLTFAKERANIVSRDIRESIALQELENAIYMLMSPPVASSDPPEISDRFGIVSAYFEAGAVAGLCDINLWESTGRVFADPLYSNKEWGVFITERTRDGLTQMRQTLSNYGDILDDRTNILLGRIINHPWNEFLLVSERRLRDGTNKVLCSNRELIKSAYLETLSDYRPYIEELESKIGKRFCALRQEHELNEIPPVFLRSISGLIYAPNENGAKDQMDQVCMSLVSG